MDQNVIAFLISFLLVVAAVGGALCFTSYALKFNESRKTTAALISLGGAMLLILEFGYSYLGWFR